MDVAASEVGPVVADVAAVVARTAPISVVQLVLAPLRLRQFHSRRSARKAKSHHLPPSPRLPLLEAAGSRRQVAVVT